MQSSFSHLVYRFFYHFLLALLMPVILLRLLWRSRANPAYRKRISERFGFVPRPDSPVAVWVHCVSVGETMAAKPLILALIDTFGERAVLVTTTTPTGSDTVRQLFADRVLHTYFPYDLSWIVRRYLRRIQPRVFISMETEIWPNFWQQCSRLGVPVMLVNARLSARATRRYGKIRGFITPVLNQAAVIACRNTQDQEHFLSLGVEADRVQVVGDLKSDIQVSASDVHSARELSQQWGASRLVFVAASTHKGEDEIILEVFAALRQMQPDLLLILVPRHPERFTEVGRLIRTTSYKTANRCSGEPFTTDTDIILGDTMGEMMIWYSCADVVFIGGSLVARGGHNPLEPLACGAAVVSGLHVFNFSVLYERLLKAEAVCMVADADGLQAQVGELLCNFELRQRIIAQGRRVLQQDIGATERIMALIRRLALQH